MRRGRTNRVNTFLAPPHDAYIQSRSARKAQTTTRATGVAIKASSPISIKISGHGRVRMEPGPFSCGWKVVMVGYGAATRCHIGYTSGQHQLRPRKSAAKTGRCRDQMPRASKRTCEHRHRQPRGGDSEHDSREFKRFHLAVSVNAGTAQAK
jgi:hypothetical protein